MKTYYVLNEPFFQLTGHWSYGTHVTARDSKAALEVSTRLGRTVIGAIECPNIFTCTCGEDAKHASQARAVAAYVANLQSS